MQQFGDAGAVKRAWPAFEENIVRGTRRDFVGEAGPGVPSMPLVSGGTPVSAERSVGSITTSAPSARLTGVV